jgi:TolB protein
LDIFVVNTDGTGRRALTSSQDDEFSPAVSPDGRSIAYIRLGSGERGVWIMNANGSNQRRLTTADVEPNFPPVWSPRGAKLAFHVSGRTA